MEIEWKWLKRMHMLDRTDELTGLGPLYSFALDELLCRSANDGGPAVCHLWRHPGALVIGQRDSRLPGAERAGQWLQAQGIPMAVRHSGGAAVPLDRGIVNLSLILPREESAAAAATLHDDFERMYALVREALAFAGRAVEKGEVRGAYCPGDYDLSIAGRKFCGMAQRRKARARIVHAFVVASGEGEERTRLVREFYARAAAGADPSQYPQVTEGSTASLEELAGLGPGAAERFVDAVTSHVAVHSANPAPPPVLPAPEEIRAMADALAARYSIRSS